MSSTKSGQDWTDGEISLIVADYFDMLRMNILGESFVKAERNREIQKLTGRSRASIEFKHQNISAVMELLEVPWLSGYAPLRNFQEALVAAVEVHLLKFPELLEAVSTPQGLAESPSVFFGPAPAAKMEKKELPAYAERIVRKFDPAKRDERNRLLGQVGEELIFNFERSRLIEAGEYQLADKVKWVSRDEGDGAGFDILSFGKDRRERLLEVKTTAGRQHAPFYLSENERRLSEEKPELFRLVRLYQATSQPSAFRLKPPLTDHVQLSPTNWRASF